MDERVLNAAIAGLLHDIGKMEQRARVDPWKPPQDAAEEGQPVHAAWSLSFIQNYVPQPYKKAALAGAYHHAPDKSPAEDHSLSELVELADKLSAGERADQPDRAERPPRQMVTIFDRISLDGQGRQGDWHYLPLQSLNLERGTLFPAGPMDGSAEGRDYDRLCEFIRAAVRQPANDGETYLENVLGALQQAAWCVPSAYYHSIPDVSLYDHSRMTAALAVCLSEMDPSRVRELLQAVRRRFYGKPAEGDAELLNQPAALLVGGDISGIQDFIYTISSKGAARTLRGRSFYLQLLTEAALRFILRKMGLPLTNLIYSGGGHFYFLAPPGVAEKLPAIQEQLTRNLLEHHGTSLYLAVTAVEVPAAGFEAGCFPEYWSKMHAALAQAKQRRYLELGEDIYPLVFQPPEKGGNPEDTCDVCGEDSRPVIPWNMEREEQAHICTLCESFASQIGKDLPSSRFIALGWVEPKPTKPGSASSALEALGMKFQLLENADQPVELAADRLTLWALDDPAGERWPSGRSLRASHLLHYTVNRVPRDTFDELQKKVEGGFERLGVLRMDVDNLGDIFKKGFGKDLATLARLATLSMQLSLFFEGWVKKLCEQGENRELIYAVYAGGDDIFLIGPWDRMPGLAQAIMADLAAYTGSHPAFHLSAGVSFIGGKYPIYQAAEDAGKALEMAKNNDGKNSFAFLGESWSWPEFKKLEEKQSRIRRLVGGREEESEMEGPQALVQVLRQLAEEEQVRARKVKGRPVFGPWMWRGFYLLTRMAERMERNGQAALAWEIRALRDDLHEHHYKEIHQWGMAARWTQLLIRKKREEEK